MVEYQELGLNEVKHVEKEGNMSSALTERALNVRLLGHAGAYGCTISGAGPTCVAVTDDPQKGERIAAAMVQAFVSSGKLAINSARVVKLDQVGAKTV